MPINKPDEHGEDDMTRVQHAERPLQHPGKAIPHPQIVSAERWLTARKKLLAHEKELTKRYDRVNAERRRLPMVKIEKGYVFDGPGGKCDFKALFEGRRQLIVYHFMFDPAWDKGCPSCTWYLDSLVTSHCSASATRLSRWYRAPRSQSSMPTGGSGDGMCRGIR